MIDPDLQSWGQSTDNFTISEFDEFIDENIRKFEEKNDYNVTDGEIISWAAQ
jgi:hypothetical protein